jgi:hypothetical protein
MKVANNGKIPEGTDECDVSTRKPEVIRTVFGLGDLYYAYAMPHEVARAKGSFSYDALWIVR